MVQASQIHHHMDVKSSDGHHVGRVDHVRDSEIKLGRLDSEAEYQHHMIPMSWIDYVDSQVHLNVTRDNAEANWIAAE